jgi:hypothetical protein
MAPSSRDRISVDLRGLKAALVARAQERGVSPSDFVRAALVAALGPRDVPERPAAPRPSRSPERVRLSLRMQRCDSEAVLRAARAVGLTTGDFVAGLVVKAAVLGRPAGAAAHLAALTESCAELATLSRDLRHLTTLLRQGSSRAAQAYRETLDSVNADVHAHLVLATAVVAELRPLLRSSRQRDLVITP